MNKHVPGADYQMSAIFYQMSAICLAQPSAVICGIAQPASQGVLRYPLQPCSR